MNITREHVKEATGFVSTFGGASLTGAATARYIMMLPNPIMRVAAYIGSLGLGVVVGKAAKQPDQVIQLVIDKDDAIEMKIKDKSSSLRLKDLALAVKKAQSAATNSAVVISADKNIKYASVVKVMDTLQRAGVQRVGLSVQLAP